MTKMSLFSTKEECPSLSLEQKLDEILRCTKCKTPMRHNIYTCSNEHLLCKNCIDDLYIEANIAKTHTFGKLPCPTCSTNVNERAYILEFLTVELSREEPTQCIWTKNGCKFKTIISNAKQNHEKLCTKQDFPCPWKSRRLCTWTGKLEDLINHTKTHKQTSVIEIEQTPKNEEEFQMTRSFTQDDITEIFDSKALVTPIIILAFRSKPEIMFYVDVSGCAEHWSIAPKYIGPPDLRKNFVTTLTIDKCESRHAHSIPIITTTGKPVWYTISSEYLFISSSTITLTRNQMRNFSTDDKFMQYTITIKQKT